MMTVYSSVSVPSVENTKSSSSSSKKSSRRTRTRSRSGLTSNCADLCSFSTKSIFQPFIRGPATLMTWAAGILYFLIIIGGPLPGEAPTFTLRGLSWVVGGHDYYQSLMASCYKDVIYPNTVSTSAKSSLESAVSATSKQCKHKKIGKGLLSP